MNNVIIDNLFQRVDGFVAKQIQRLRGLLLAPLIGMVVVSVVTVVVMVVLWVFMRRDLQKQAETVNSNVKIKPPKETVVPLGDGDEADVVEDEVVDGELVEAVDVQPDDLKKIDGIGPRTAAALADAGITTFAALAGQTPEALRELLDAAGVTRVVDPATWPEQAAVAATGDMDALAELQARLKSDA